LVEDKEYFRKAWKEIKGKDLKFFVKLFLIKFGLFFYPFLPLYDVSYGFLFPFFIYGLLTFKGSKEKFVFGVILSLFFIKTFVFSGSPRHRSPMEPYYIILGIYGVNAFLEKVKKVILF